MVQQRVGGELGVGRLGVERRRGAEHEQAAGLAGGRRDARCFLAGTPPAVRIGAERAAALPAVRGEDVLPAGPRVVVVARPAFRLGAGGRRDHRLPRRCLGEQRRDGVQRVAFFFGDGGDAGRAAAGQLPWFPGRVGPSGGWRGDGEAAFAAGLDQRLAGRGDREPGIAACCPVDPVQDVQAAAGRGLGVAGDDPLPQAAEAVAGERVTVGDVNAAGDGAAFELEHLQAAGHGAADDAEPVVGAVAEPLRDLRRVRPFGLPALPFPGGCLRPVSGSGHDRAACVSRTPARRRVSVSRARPRDRTAVTSWSWPGCPRWSELRQRRSASASFAACGSASHCSAGMLGGRVTAAAGRPGAGGAPRTSATAASPGGM